MYVVLNLICFNQSLVRGVRLTLDSRLSSWKCWSVRETRGMGGHLTSQLKLYFLIQYPVLGQALGQTSVSMINYPVS